MVSIEATAAARRASQTSMAARSAPQLVVTSWAESARSGKGVTRQGMREDGGTSGATYLTTTGGAGLSSVWEQADAITAKAASITIRQGRIHFLQISLLLGDGGQSVGRLLFNSKDFADLARLGGRR